MDIGQQVIILSAEHTSQTPEGNAIRTQTLSDCIEDIGLPFKQTLGVYNGVSEQTFVVLIRNQLDIDVLKDFAFKNFDQESVLYQDANREAYLFFRDGTISNLGHLNAVPKEAAIKSGSYTIMNDLYYTTTKR